MRILSGVIAFVLASSLPSSDAFVPALRIPRPSITQLAAARPPPPVPPPPPPAKPDTTAVLDNLLQKLTSSSGEVTSSNSGGDGDSLGDVLNGLLNDLSARIQGVGGGVTLPSLPDLTNKLPDLGSMQGLQDLRQQFIDLDESVIAAVDRIANQLQDGVATDYPQLAPYLERIQALLAPVLQSPSLSLVVSALLTYTVVSSLLNWDRSPPPSQPYPAGKYDPIAARAYFDTKLHLVVARGLEILVQSLQFGLTLLRDKLRYVCGCGYIIQVVHTKGRDEGFFSFLHMNVMRFAPLFSLARLLMCFVQRQHCRDRVSAWKRIGSALDAFGAYVHQRCVRTDGGEVLVSLYLYTFTHTSNTHLILCTPSAIQNNTFSGPITFDSYRLVVTGLHSRAGNTAGPSSSLRHWRGKTNFGSRMGKTSGSHFGKHAGPTHCRRILGPSVQGQT